MSVLQNRRQAVPQAEIGAAGTLQPVEPAYNKNATASPIADHLDTPRVETYYDAPIVQRVPRTVGMRYLYAHGANRQPLQQLGNGDHIGIAVWSGEFQPDLIGPIHDAGFNDALYQAGYPGFNLGLSFKVQTLPTQTTGPGVNMRMRRIPQPSRSGVNPLSRPSGAPKRRRQK